MSIRRCNFTEAKLQCKSFCSCLLLSVSRGFCSLNRIFCGKRCTKVKVRDICHSATSVRRMTFLLAYQVLAWKKKKKAMGRHYFSLQRRKYVLFLWVLINDLIILGAPWFWRSRDSSGHPYHWVLSRMYIPYGILPPSMGAVACTCAVVGGPLVHDFGERPPSQGHWRMD